jgi:tetratricopeptide (TPR) repeat protein
MLIALMLEDWNTAVLAGRRAESHFLADPKGMSSLRLVLWRKLAYALARTGQFAEADSMIAKTPLDCDPCVRARGSIAAAERNWISAGHDFSVVAARSPDIPFADAAWGEMLLRKGEYDAAIAKFRESNLKGPHFADPLEMWGEALMQKNRSDLALDKFQEANKYAPNWGRLHLEWGKALMYLGRGAEARQQFSISARLDLSAADAAALARWRETHA